MDKTGNVFLDSVYGRIYALDEALYKLDDICSFDDVKASTRSIMHYFRESEIELSDGILYSAEHNKYFREELKKYLYDCLNLCRNYSYASNVFNEQVVMNYQKKDNFIAIQYDFEKNF